MLSVNVIVVERDTVTERTGGVIVTVVVTMGRGFVAVLVCVVVFVVVLQIETVFGDGLGHTFWHAGQIRWVAKPFNHDGGLRLRGAGGAGTFGAAGAVGILKVVVSVVTTVVSVANSVI